ncbi:hypothetical protein PENCOP_c001G07899 [Penicillium coprophilum]|uniref:Uncharacterized protein n=1 Tax=Penicillium coprophilum TaxID=36646 RepID=A0A1V6V866_9EURO|nr:hypothetical protein PENCOP_c001G07899 [Penicillium coprophilum]
MAIAGLGGVGKTQLVLEFAFLIKEARPDYSIFWVPAFSREAFEQAYAEIAIRLGIIHTGENEEVKSLVKKHLEEQTGRKWIMIVDNADDEDILFGAQLEDGIVEYLPESEDGFILFTSRHQKAAVALANSDVIELGQMSAWEATDFLGKSLTRKELLCDDSETTELLNELTHLPLAIAQAAAYLNENKISVSKYLYLLRNTEQDMASLLSREFRDRTRYKYSKNAIATTWLVSFNQIRKKDPTAAEMLALIAFIEPKAIPRSIFPPIKPEERLEYAIGTLCAYDFITRRENEDIYDMHRLVHLAAQIWTRKHDLANATETKLIKHLNGVFPPNEYENRDLWREYFPHALALLQANKESHLKEVYSLCVKVGLCLVVDGRYREAISWLEMSFSWCSHNLPEEDSDRQLSQHVLALALLDNGEVTKSIELLQVLVRAQNSLAERDPKRLISQHVLSRAYLDNDQVDEAIELLQYIATIQEEVFEDHHPDRLASEHVLARAYLRKGRTEEAIKILQHVVSTAEKTLEKQHPDRLISQHVLGRAFLENGEVKKAIQLLQHVVTMRENHFDEQHPHRLEGQHFLARAFLADGQKTEAIKILQHVVMVRKGLLGPQHPKFLESYNLLSLAKEREENASQAI